jgi:AhpD family alkylhydroperoxidase
MEPGRNPDEVKMIEYPVHSLDTAPPASQPLLRDLQAGLGLVPNLAATMAESPQLLGGFLSTREIQSRGTFTPGEVQVLSLTNAYENGCGYCMALHSALALKEGVAPASVAALRAGRSPDEPRLAALSALSRRLVRERGRIRDEDMTAFLAAGYTRAQALEVVLGIAVSIQANFAHHLTQCPLDEVFAAQRWSDAAP